MRSRFPSLKRLSDGPAGPITVLDRRAQLGEPWRPAIVRIWVEPRGRQLDPGRSAFRQLDGTPPSSPNSIRANALLRKLRLGRAFGAPINLEVDWQ